MFKGLLIIVLCTCMLFTVCSTDRVSGSTETTNNKVGLYGKLVDESGNPVSGASVKAIGVEIETLNKEAVCAGVLSSDTDSVATDDSGYYSFTSLEAGTYNLQGDYDNGSLVVLITDIEYDSAGAIQEVATDTMRAPGKIAGTVTTTIGDNSGVLCYIPGTSFFAMSDDTGGFVLANIPPGSYTVTYRKEQMKTTSDKDIEVRSEEKTVLSTRNMEADPGYPPPAPVNLSASYDTLHGCVRLSWKPVEVADLAGYAVYRSDTASSFPSRINDKLTTDTVYYDTVFSDAGDTTDRQLIYRLKAQDEEANVSTVYSKAVVIEAPLPAAVRTFISLKVLNTVDDTVGIGDTVEIAASYRNDNRRNVKLEWSVAGDSLVRTVDDTVFSGSDTIRFAWNDTSVHRMYIAITDEGTSVWRDSTAVTVVQDVPAIDAGNDTTVKAEDTVRLHGVATQRFGHIAKWEWRIGSGEWEESGPDTFFIAPPSSGLEERTTVCSVRVTDEDGNDAVDDVAIVSFRNVSSVVAESQSTFILLTDGTLWACGLNDLGLFGNGTTAGSSIPIKIMDDVQSVAAKEGHILILKKDATLWACGHNGYGELCDGTTEDRTTFVQVMSSVRTMDAQYRFSMVVKTDGTLWACGSNRYYGQLGIEGTVRQIIPLSQVMSDVQSVSASDMHTLILGTDGTLWGCGYNSLGQLGVDNGGNDVGYNPDDYRETPVEIMSNVKKMDAGHLLSLILTTNGTLWGCGMNRKGKLGDGTIVNRSTPVPIMSDVQDMSTGLNHTLILKTDGSLWGCGDNFWNTFLMDSDVKADYPTPQKIMDNVRTMTAGHSFSMVVKTDGSLWACGRNIYGQIGDGSQENRDKYVRIVPSAQ
jgi:alpha-tubulin suppressor-like RCC1 family protein